MEIIVDANVFKSYFEEVHIGVTSTLTNSTVKIFENHSGMPRICIDDEGKIEHEWKTPVDGYWFDQWYSDMLIAGKIKIIPIQNHGELCKQVYNLGFPKCNDIWYLRTAKSTLSYRERIHLITEDIDFYDPKSKKNVTSEKRLEIIRGGKGDLAKYLRKKENIDISCVEAYVSNL